MGIFRPWKRYLVTSLTVALLLTSSCTAFAATQDISFAEDGTPMAHLESGELAGTAQDSLLEFKDIPYGGAPANTLNVFLNKDRLAETQAEKQKMPVFVWLQDNDLKEGGDSAYDTSSLAEDRRGAIIVTLNYRSLPQSEENAETKDERALSDQQEALKWVQNNIDAFYGDKDEVTLAGQGTGGKFVMQQMVTPAANGLFQYAVAMSAITPETEKILTQGQRNDIKIFVNGFTRHEGSFYVAQIEKQNGHALTTTEFYREVGKLCRLYGKNTAFKQQLFAEYRPEQYSSPAEALSAVITDMCFVAPTDCLNRALAPNMTIFAYEFNDNTAPALLDADFAQKAAHSYDLPYLFTGFNLNGTATILTTQQQWLARQMVHDWVHVGDLGKAVWQPFDLSKGNTYLRIDRDGGIMTTRTDFDRVHHMAFWRANS